MLRQKLLPRFCSMHGQHSREWLMGIERRIMPRIATSIEIAYGTSGVFMNSLMMNLSSGGIFIKTDQPFPIDTALEMRMQLPGDPESMHINGRVVWTKPESHAFPAGMGIQFIDMPLEYFEKIKSFAKKTAL
jgi:uncharacterized protein (TIGR02266 family)